METHSTLSPALLRYCVFIETLRHSQVDRSTDDTIEKYFITTVPMRRGILCHERPPREAPGSDRRQMERGKCLCWVLWEVNRQGSAISLGIGSF
jgi:hypothetical protein